MTSFKNSNRDILSIRAKFIDTLDKFFHEKQKLHFVRKFSSNGD